MQRCKGTADAVLAKQAADGRLGIRHGFQRVTEHGEKSEDYPYSGLKMCCLTSKKVSYSIHK